MVIIKDLKYILTKLEGEDPFKIVVRTAKENMGRSERDNTSIYGDTSEATTG